MTITKKSITMEITLEEAEMITKALHAWRKGSTEDAKPLEWYEKAVPSDLGKVKDLRNAFAELVGVHYMGADA